MSSRLASPSVRLVWVCRSPFRSFSVTTVGQLACERRLDLTSVLAERGLDGRHAEPAVDVLLLLGGEQLAALRVEQAVLVQLQSRPDRHLADADVVRPSSP